MEIIGIRNEPLGQLEHFEIDRNGVLTALIVRLSASIDTTRRIAADRIRGFERGKIRVALCRADLHPSDGDVWTHSPESALRRSSAW